MADQAGTALPDGMNIAGHRIEKLLGNGAFGQTYLVRNLNDNSRWVLKEFYPRHSAQRDPRTLEVMPALRESHRFKAAYSAFKNEAEMLRALPPHRYIVGVKGLFRKHGTIYILMELIDGVTLKAYQRSNYHVTEDDLLATLRQIADGLAHLHGHNLLHRDLKPDNIMVNRHGEPVLIDFGAARVLRENQKLTSVFTPAYAPIEQQPVARDVDVHEGPWTDIYALGVVAYEFATGGTKPADAETRLHDIRARKADPYVPCARLAKPGFSASFCKAIDWALGFLPHQRPGVAADWIAALSGGEVSEHSVHRDWQPPPRIEQHNLILVTPANPRRAEPQRRHERDPDPSTDFGGSVLTADETAGGSDRSLSRSDGSLSNIWILIVLVALLAMVVALAVVLGGPASV